MDISFLQILGGIITASISVGAVLFGIGKFIEGKASAKRDMSQDELTAMKILQSKVETLTTEVERLTGKVNELEVTLELESKEKKQILAILQARNPEMDKTFEAIRIYISTNSPLLERVRDEVLPVVTKLDKYLNKQTI